MANTCRVCKSGSIRSAIEADHLVGQSIRSLAKDYSASGLSESSIRRHLHRHVQKSPLRAPVVTDEMSLADVVGSVVSGIADALEVRRAAIAKGDTTATLRSIAEGRNGAEVLAKLEIVDGEAVAAELSSLVRLRDAVLRGGWVDSYVVRTIAKANKEADPETAAEFDTFADLVDNKKKN